MINPELSTKLTLLNRQVVNALATNNAEQILKLCTDSIRKNTAIRNDLFKLVEETNKHVDTAKYAVKRQFYEIRHGRGESVNVDAETGNEHNFQITYISPTRKSFVTIGALDDSTRSTAVVTIFYNYGGEWKLGYLWLSPMRALGRDAVDWYYKARQQYASDDLADASNSISICQYLLHPGGKIWRYLKESDMSILPAQIKNEAERKYHFPLSVTAVRTTPSIFGVASQEYQGRFYPVIKYVTTLALADTLALSRECDSLNTHIGDIFQGLDHNNKKLLYRAYHSTPTGDDDIVLHYGFVRNSLANWYDK